MIIQIMLLGGGLAAAVGVVRRRQAARRRLPGPDAGTEPPEPDDTPSDARARRREEAQREARTLDRSLGFSAAGLAGVLGGGLGSAALGTVGLVCLVPPALLTVHMGWQDVRAKRKLTFLGLEAVSVAFLLGAGYAVYVAIDLVIFLGTTRVILATQRKAEDELSRAFADWAETAWLLRDGVEVQVPVEALVAGDRVVVRGGEPVPCDGVVLDGVIAVDERALTGESQPTEKMAGAEVCGSTLAVAGEAIVEVRTSGRETAAARIEALVARSTSYEETLDLESGELADRTVPPTLVMAGMGLAARGVPGAVGGLWSNHVDVIWSVYPLAVLMLMRTASEQGILIKDGRSLRALRGIDTVVFDKTGTLTLDALTVAAIHPLEGWTTAELLAIAAAVEHRQTHPIAAAILAAAEQAAVTPRACHAPSVQRGLGLEAVVDGATVVLGSDRLMGDCAIPIPDEAADRIGQATGGGRTVTYLAIGGRLAGWFELQAQIRPEARRVIADLRARDIEPMILSGDAPGPTRALARSLGVERWFARVLPEGKAACIDALRGEGRAVCFVGDGINDALAMRRARVSVSMTGASALAVDSAQIVLRDGSLDALGRLLDLGAHDHATSDHLLAVSGYSSVASLGGVLFAGFSVALPAFIYAGALTGGLGWAVRRARRLPGGRDEGPTSPGPDPDGADAA